MQTVGNRRDIRAVSVFVAFVRTSTAHDQLHEGGSRTAQGKALMYGLYSVHATSPLSTRDILVVAIPIPTSATPRQQLVPLGRTDYEARASISLRTSSFGDVMPLSRIVYSRKIAWTTNYPSKSTLYTNYPLINSLMIISTSTTSRSRLTPDLE
jgi:hypothetical protein